MKVYFTSYENWKARAASISAAIYELRCESGCVSVAFADGSLFCEITIDLTSDDFADYEDNLQEGAIKCQ